MPIRINFLAEEQAVEELRRRDPVKRAIYGVAAALVVMAGWFGINQMRVMSTNGLLQVQKDDLSKVDKNAKAVEANMNQTKEVHAKIDQLKLLAANRFLWAPVLDTLQKTSVSGIQITHFVAFQQYAVVLPTHPARGSADKPKPGSSTERIRLTIDGRDFGIAGSANPNYSKYMDALSATPMLKTAAPGANNVRLRDVSLPVNDPSDPTRSMVNFGIECFLPEKVR